MQMDSVTSVIIPYSKFSLVRAFMRVLILKEICVNHEMSEEIFFENMKMLELLSEEQNLFCTIAEKIVLKTNKKHCPVCGYKKK